MKGFTLVELMIVVALGAAIALVLFSILSHNTSFYYKETTLVNEGLSLSGITDSINSYVKQSVDIAAAYPLVDPLFTTDSDTLVLKIPSISGSEVVSNSYDYLVVQKDSDLESVLRMQVFPDALSERKPQNQVLTSNLESISFGYFDNLGNSVLPDQAAQVEISVTVLSKLGSVESSRTSKTRTFLRNN